MVNNRCIDLQHRFEHHHAMTSTIEAASEKIHENRVRRMAGRQELMLVKSRRRDVNAVDYGGYWIVDQSPNGILRYGGEWGVTLDEAEAWLRDEPSEGQQ